VLDLAQLPGFDLFRVQPQEHGRSASPDGIDEHFEYPGETWRVVGIEMDVRDPSSLEADATIAEDRFGGLHVAVNNAGVINGGRSWELTLSEWHDVMDVNP
jgi:NAD(P)-dependent dehydrogenase (short-subunit alcohol dehydrogenase family)